MRQYKKYTANIAENNFYTNRVLIISWVHRYNWIVTEISKKRTIQRYLYSPPGRTERSVPFKQTIKTQSYVCLIANTLAGYGCG